jgi:endonuclease YncB( thermonuclease family)
LAGHDFSIPAGVHPHDGDTVSLGGVNGRLYGVDAFEIGQQGQSPTGPLNLGEGGRQTLMGVLRNGGTATATGDVSYNRPVVSINTPSGDAGHAVVASGYGLPYTQYLANDPTRLSDYVQAQDDAIADERGAYAGSFQAPWNYRHGTPGPLMGKVPLSDDQQRSYLSTITQPNATPADLSNWYAEQGRAATNVPNIFQYARKFPNPTAPDYFQQQDVQGTPILPNNPGLAARILNRFNTGVMDLAEMPGDLISNLAGRVGINIPSASQGVDYISRKTGFLARAGDPNWAPRSTLERYAGSVAENAGQSVLPVMGTYGAGAKLLGTATELGTGAAPIARNMLRDVVANPGRNLIAEAGGVAGSGIAGQAAQDYAPGNPYVSIAAQLAGGFAGGMGAGVAASRGAPLPEAIQTGAKMGEEQAQGNAQQNLEQNANGRGKDAPNAPVGGDYLPPIKTPPGVPQWDSDGAPLVDMVDNGNGGVAPVYGVPGQPGSRPAAAPAPIDHTPTPAYPNGLEPSRVSHPRGGQPATADMASDTPSSPSVSAPVDAWDEFADHPALSPRATDPWAEFADHKPIAMGRDLSPEDIASTVQNIAPGDVRPIPSNQVESADEAASIGAGMYPPVQVPDERSMLPTYTLPGQERPRRNPLDLASWLRTQGGVADTGGDLAHLGIDNRPRDMDFARDEGFLGPLVNPNGMSVDEAARSAWEAGYFPDHYDRPTPNDFLDALQATHQGAAARVFHPSNYDAIDAYYGARENRQLVEQAQQAGSPMVHDLGQPVTMSDLDANSAPATAYEDLPKAGGVAGNINVAHLETPGDIQRVLSTVSNHFDGFDAARRGQISQAETQALADEMGMTASDLLKRRNGQALNAEQALAARQILAKSSDEIRRLAAKAEGGSDADLAAFHQALVRHVAIQEQVSGATAEAGRALAQFRMTASSRDIPRIHKNMIESAGGRDKLEEIARGIVDLEKDGAPAGGVSKFAQNAIKPKFSDKLIELYYNSLLSNPKTHVVNTVSNALTAIAQLPEHGLAAGLGALRGGDDRVTAQEVAQRAIGMMQGAREGVDAFKRVAKTGAVLDPVTKVEARTHYAIGGKAGSVIRTPTRMLEAEDELFKSIGRRMELNGLAVRQARAEGLTGDAFNQRVQDLAANPTDDMIERSMDYARYITFQRPLGPAGQALSNLTQKAPALKLVIPFIRTPTNMVKYAVERSPLAPVSSHWRADVLAGGARRDLALAKAALGTGLGMTIAQYVADGRITGGQPADKKQGDLLKADGWQPYSIRVGDKYLSYARLDPFSTTISTAADIATAINNGSTGDPDKAAAQLAGAFVDQLDNKTFLSGLSDLMHTLDPNGNGSILDRGKAWAGREVGGFVPSVVSQMAREVDPYSRAQKGFIAPIQNRVPFWSRSLPAKQDAWGRDVVNQGSLGPDFISPLAMRTRQNDPVNARLLQLGIGMSPPSKTIDGLTLTEAQYRDYNRQSGDLIYRSLAPVVNSPAWLAQQPAVQIQQIEDVKREARKQVRLGMFGMRR